MKKLIKGGIHIAKKAKARVNEDITADQVRLISEKGEQLGIIPLEEALENAQQAGLDLIEISPDTDPPVCKLVDYGKLKYEKKKKAHLSKKKQHVVKLKEIRLRPRIDSHDLETKMNMGRKFLKDGCKLKVTLMFRGREMSRLDLGDIVMEKVVEMLKDIAAIEKQNPLEGRRMSLIFAAI
ncbi:MAG TPA: translation initiation factor IF-3 [Candidatus Marinimicrobia bacterium]|nr:translation initiation factor IF-3 [Candidatus Neomarinimicrobiota bacterium]MDP6260500.1 translation initiation factor IF-3 [Candidatus Neomarinimicrobiota bacterium]MDP7127177.1 translation initiation factor IF-3 [Candidatus Neomarinimicrobiota bacterium]MDP7336697.1 translation initiation factor IF-3 [Candidatus Neomarinimicrobiota bacterium]MDP7474705.1 translation initiation factor IF-3 [Candidatus Neomarinimicrobiota bacterium]